MKMEPKKKIVAPNNELDSFYSQDNKIEHSLIPAIEKELALAQIDKHKIPPVSQFEDYNIELVVQEFGQHYVTSEISYLEFKHKLTNKVFRVNIMQVAQSLNACHTFSWVNQNQIVKDMALEEPIGTMLAVNCMDYFNPRDNHYWVEEFRKEAWEKSLERKRSNLKGQKQMVEKIKIQQRQDIQKQKRVEMMTELMDFKRVEPEIPNLGSDLQDSEEEDQLDLSSESFSSKSSKNSKPKLQHKRQQAQLESSLKSLKNFLIVMMNKKMHRSCKFTEIRREIKRANHVIRDKTLKEILTQLCNYTKNKFSLKEKYLSKEEIFQRSRLDKVEAEMKKNWRQRKIQKKLVESSSNELSP